MKNFIIFIVASLLAMAVSADGEFVTLESGQVIAVPPTGQVCRFDPVYCFSGWREDGSFPMVEFGDVIREKLDNCASEARDYPLCPTGLSLGGSGSNPYPCYELNTGD